MKANADNRLPPVLAPLTALPRWVIWRWGKTKKGKPTKVPYQASFPNKYASSTAPKTWSDFATAVATEAQADGIGFCLLNSNLGAFDIDDCRDPETGAIDPWATELVARAGSYTEITVSGTGLRIIGRAAGPKIHCKRSVANGVTVEIYRKAERYIAMTGNVLPGSPALLADLDAVMDEVFAELGGEKASAKPRKAAIVTASANPGATIDELDDVIRNGCGDRWEGDRSKAVWFVANEMLRRGYLAKAIAPVLLDRANKISDHIYDQPNPEEAAHRQVAKALQSIDFLRGKPDGPPLANRPDNIRIALLKLGVTVRYDRFADRILLDGLPGFGPILDDAAVNNLWLAVDQRFRFQPNREVMGIVLNDTARLNSFHPVIDYLNGLRWDGVPRLDTWLNVYAGAEDNKYTRAVGSLVLIAAVRRVRKPGCKFDEMLVLEQPEQGTDKSTALAVLAVSEDWFSDDLPLNVEGKRVIEMLRGRWIIEAAELSGMKKADVEHLKATLSRRIDRARMAWGRLPNEVPRQCVIIGTTNKSEYLRDTTGNRRFWPILVQAFKIDDLRRDRDQLWAEAAAREMKGESIRLAPELWPMAASEQRQRLADDPYVAVLAEHLGDKTGKIRAVDVWTILDLRGAQLTQEVYQRASEAMKRIGWKRPNKAGVAKFDGKLMVAYVRGNSRKPITVIRDHEGLYVTDGSDRQAEEETDESERPKPKERRPF